ncbi:MAG: hypothetical protein KDA21_12860 [Phycisphaerales bacterium]|nr:hypothetical protein [Phycisphaerales bacterium]
MTMRWFWSLVLTLVAAGVTAAQTADIKVDFETGDSGAYTLARLITLTQQPEGAAPSTRTINHVAGVTLTVDSISDKGVLSVSLRFNSLMIAMTADGGPEMTYRGDGDRPAIASDDTLKALGDALRRGRLTYNVSPEGEITTVRGLNEFEAEVAKQETYDRADLLGFFSEDALPGMLAPLYQADGASKAARTVGRGWQDVETVALPPVAAVDVTTDWRLEAVANNTATMKGTIGFELRTAPNPPEDAPGLALRDAGGTTQLVWDLEKNELLNRVSSQNLTTVWTLGSTTLVQKQTVRIMQMRAEKQN